jgi:hypothetical protein
LGVAYLNRPFIVYAYLAILLLEWIQNGKIVERAQKTKTVVIGVACKCSLQFLAKYSLNYFGNTPPIVRLKKPVALMNSFQDLIFHLVPKILGFRVYEETLFFKLIFPMFYAGCLILVYLILRKIKSEKSVVWSALTLSENGFPLFLIFTGFFSLLGYLFFSAPSDGLYHIRYCMLFLFVPIGGYALLSRLLPDGTLRKSAAFFLAALLVFNSSLIARESFRVVALEKEGKIRHFIDYLFAHDLRYGYGPLFLSFFTGEKLVISPMGFSNIPELSRQIERHEGSPVFEIRESPCANGEKFEDVYICL